MFTAEEIRARWVVTPYRLRRWKREMGPGAMGHLRDWVIAALYVSNESLAVADILDCLDWVNRCRYGADEVSPVLDALEREGFTIWAGVRWSYDQSRLAAERTFIL